MKKYAKYFVYNGWAIPAYEEKFEKLNPRGVPRGER